MVFTLYKLYITVYSIPLPLNLPFTENLKKKKKINKTLFSMVLAILIIK